MVTPLMDTVFLVWLIHAAVGATLSVPVLWIGRKRIRWTNWELLALVVPFCVWLLLSLSPFSYGRKSFANIGEPIYISFAMPIAALLRVGIGQNLGRATVILIVLGCLCGVAVATFFLVAIKPIR
jgi:dolichyl-phosphate-mannose--protein O-mannosyl transferase